MSKENEKEIGKEFSPEFLPIVSEKMILSVSKKLFKNPEKFVTETLSRMDKENSDLRKFLLWEANYYFSPYSFLLGNSFVYLTVSEEYKKIKKSSFQISPGIFEYLSKEILDTDEVYQKKFLAAARETAEDIENNFQINQYFDENSETGFIGINIDDREKFAQIMENSQKKYININEECKKKNVSIIPLPTFYYKENRSLMRAISAFSLYRIRPTTSASSFSVGAMLTYELLRRQAETDYLEKEFQK